MLVADGRLVPREDGGFAPVGELGELALLGIEAARLLGMADPEVAGWVDTARSTFTLLGSAPLVGALERAAARSAATV